MSETHIQIIILLVLILFSSSCQAQKEDNKVYTKGKASRFGTGKFYMGREIAQVMGHQGAYWLEREEREEEERTDLAIELLPLEKDDVVADIGAGTGYYTFRMSKLVPEGKVIAVDIQPKMLAILKEQQAALGIKNVATVLGTEQSPNLAENSVDLVLFVDVYHELAYPYEMMQNIVKALSPKGKVVLLEYRAEDPKVPIKKLHKMTSAQVIKEMQAVGLKFVENNEKLPWQHFLVFEKREN